MKRATLREVALKAGTSMMTVSRVINDKDPVSPETKARVLKAIEELQYEPHQDARSLRGGKTGRIGLIVSDIRNPFYAQVVGDMEDLAELNRMAIVVTDTSRKLAQEKKAIKSLMDIRVDSIVIAPEGYESQHLLEVIDSGVGLISFGVHFDDPRIPEVSIDEEQGASQAGRYLRECGIKSVLIYMGNPRKLTTRGRIDGFIKGFGHVPEDRITCMEVDWKISCEAVRSLKELPEAFFCYNDMMAMGVIKALMERNIEIGKDVKVIGYDDVYMAEIAGLSTIRIPIRRMVEDAFKMILSGKWEKIKYVPELIMRKSAQIGGDGK